MSTRRRLSNSCIIASVLSLLIGPTNGATVSSTPAQTFSGVGGSGAWWPMDLFHFPEAARQNLSDLLFSATGLGLSSYRWNIGGGGVNVSNPVRAPETFYVAPGVYDWNKDAQGVYFLNAAAKRGVPSLTAFVNSAPAPMTAGKTSCNSQFVTGSGAAYGTFLADVLSHFRGQGINISYISPMNEPDSSFGPSPCGQEGMQVVPNQRAEVVRELYKALSAKGLQGTVGILADESSSLSNARNEYASWLPQVINQVAALVHHTYDFPSDDSYASYASNVRSLFPGKITWMSEVCCSLGNADGSGRGWSQGYDPTIKNALMFSGMVFQSFLVANEPHYDDGLIYYDSQYAQNGNFQLYLTKHFWTFKHFGNFVKPGSQRHEITGSDANRSTLAVSTSTTYNIIAMNPGNSDTTLTLTFPDATCAGQAFRTSASEDFATVAGAARSGNNWVLSLRAMSLTTFVFNRRSC
ncbi:glycoside hydrolase family 5 protein [Pleurotus eryngii]|uniref:Glycoside hydrolase family 5 protein n=1 Tax=Pleurotus eryngii TaxID=5323 RepID=A0A9P5ZWU7_PLEER|nr:glycoside hydrolase family 5 protein [Pleurotus eryngii]